MKKKLVATVLVLSLLMGITCFAETASYNGGTVTYTLNTSASGNKSSGVGTTGYDNPGYLQYVVVFGYDSKGTAVISADDQSQATACAITALRTGIKNYKSTHYIKDAYGQTLKKYTLPK